MRLTQYLAAICICIACAGCDSTAEDTTVVGQLESDRIEISAEVFEPIIEITVEEGQHVSAGELLLRQDNSRIVARIQEAQAALAQSKARLDELVRGPRKEQIDAASANLQGAKRELEYRSAEFERAQKVFERQLAAPESVDRAKAELDGAQANLELQQARLQELLSGTTVEELAQAEQAVRQGEARLSSLRIDLDRHDAHAPVDGVVDSRLFEIGERPGIGKPMLILLPGKQPYARVYIPERMRVQVSPGTKARIHVDGLAGPLDGEVRWVASEATFTPYFALTERDRRRLSFVAKVDIANTGRRLPDGVPVEVELLLDQGDSG